MLGSTESPVARGRLWHQGSKLRRRQGSYKVTGTVEPTVRLPTQALLWSTVTLPGPGRPAWRQDPARSGLPVTPSLTGWRAVAPVTVAEPWHRPGRDSAPRTRTPPRPSGGVLDKAISLRVFIHKMPNQRFNRRYGIGFILFTTFSRYWFAYRRNLNQPWKNTKTSSSLKWACRIQTSESHIVRLSCVDLLFGYKILIPLLFMCILRQTSSVLSMHIRPITTVLPASFL